jgi:hypothetical protein
MSVCAGWGWIRTEDEDGMGSNGVEMGWGSRLWVHLAWVFGLAVGIGARLFAKLKGDGDGI